MTDAFEHQLASLTEVVDRLPSRPLAGPAIGRTPSNGVRDSSDGADDEQERRWAELDAYLPSLGGLRVLVVGERADADAQAFSERGANAHAIDWRVLDPETHGTFDLVHCRLLLHRCSDPMGLLQSLRGVTAPSGTLLMATMLLADPERSEYLRFVPAGHGSDPSWWFVPGRLAVRWMLQAAGYEVQEEFGEQPGPRDRLALVSAYLRATASGHGSSDNGDLAVDRLGDRMAAGRAGADGHLPRSGP
jgi:SAM-dependent methyltransferase